MDSLDDETRLLVEGGDIRIIEEKGKQGGPVMVDTTTGRFVKGTNQPSNANDIGEISKLTAIKRTGAYRDAWESIFNLGGEDGAGMFAELVEKLWWAVQGAPQLADCAHLGCGKKHLSIIKPDAKVMMQMVESFVGPNKRQVEHTGAVEHLHELLMAGGSDEPMTLWQLDPRGSDSPDARKAALLADGTVEEAWFADARLLERPEQAVDGPDLPEEVPELPPIPESPIAE